MQVFCLSAQNSCRLMLPPHPVLWLMLQSLWLIKGGLSVPRTVCDLVGFILMWLVWLLFVWGLFFFKGKIRIIQNKLEELLTQKKCVFITAGPTLSPVYRRIYREAHSISGIWLSSNNIVTGRQRLEWTDLVDIYAGEENKWQSVSMSVSERSAWWEKEQKTCSNTTASLLPPLKSPCLFHHPALFSLRYDQIRNFHLHFLVHTFMVHLFRNTAFPWLTYLPSIL